MATGARWRVSPLHSLCQDRINEVGGLDLMWQLHVKLMTFFILVAYVPPRSGETVKVPQTLNRIALFKNVRWCEVWGPGPLDPLKSGPDLPRALSCSGYGLFWDPFLRLFGAGARGKCPSWRPRPPILLRHCYRPNSCGRPSNSVCRQPQILFWLLTRGCVRSHQWF